jgi:dsDNA-binding SOS-regulon protein
MDYCAVMITSELEDERWLLAQSLSNAALSVDTQRESLLLFMHADRTSLVSCLKLFDPGPPEALSKW